ncbi:MAG TPA: response regulator, partial [Acidimicrobiales bacterium]
MAHPSRIDERIRAYLHEKPDVAAKVTSYEIPGFFARKQVEDDLREREEQYRSVFEAATDAMLVISMDGTVAAANPAARRLYGYSEDEFVGLSVGRLACEGGAGELERFRDDVRALGRAYMEATTVAKDGHVFDIEARGTTFRYRKQQHLLVIIADITARKRHEEELRAARDAAETATRAKSAFLASMSHELRTPLNAIIGYSEMLQEDVGHLGADHVVDDLEKIRSSGMHLMNVINDILDLSKVEAGRMDLFVETFDVGAMVADVVSTVRPLIARSGNVLTVGVPDDLGEMRSDLTKVRQALLNLLTNASKFTERGTIDVSVSRDVADGRPWLTFAVADSGIGMTDEQQARLFQPFTQADSSTTRRYGGTGLGLFISQHFCQMMGGQITCTSAVGAGSTFVIRLPASIDARQDEATDHGTARDSALRGHILVIDDDPFVQDLLRRSLEADGYRVVTASDGTEALRLAREVRPQVITLDVLLPGMDGWELLLALKSDADLCDIPVIMMSVVDQAELGLSLGAADFITKPIDRDRLLRVLGKYCPRASASVLVVDDDFETRHLLRRMLEPEGFTVAEAGDGQSALAAIAGHRPSLVLLDLMMPRMDGFEFLVALGAREEWRDLPVVVLTAKDLTADEHERISGRVESILRKGAHGRERLLAEVRARVAESTRLSP